MTAKEMFKDLGFVCKDEDGKEFAYYEQKYKPYPEQDWCVISCVSFLTYNQEVDMWGVEIEDGKTRTIEFTVDDFKIFDAIKQQTVEMGWK